MENMLIFLIERNCMVMAKVSDESEKGIGWKHNIYARIKKNVNNTKSSHIFSSI